MTSGGISEKSTATGWLALACSVRITWVIRPRTSRSGDVPPASESGAGVKISVTDSGKGIAAGQLEAIFTPYFTTKAEGTGLGLAVVHNIVEQHGGTIQVASQEGKGATFTLCLPVNITRKDPQG